MSINQSQLGNLIGAICSSSISCFQQLDSALGENAENNNQILIASEFAFFFIHQMQRDIFVILGEKERDKLFDQIMPIIASIFIDSFRLSDGAAEDNMLQLKHSFIHSYNLTENEYAECKIVFDADNPFTAKATLTLLCQRIAKLYGNTWNPEVFRLCIEIVSNALKDINMPQRIKSLNSND